jgi:predicted amidophosphoribosyltransferase
MQAILLSRLLGALVILFMLFDGANRLVPWPVVTEAMDRIGYGSSDALARALGVISMACSALTQSRRPRSWARSSGPAISVNSSPRI